jgi:CBS domain-containing protein
VSFSTQHHSSRTIQEIFLRVGYTAAETDDFDPIRRLPVMNQDDELVGILSLGDLAVDTDNDRQSAEALEEISKPSRPDR